MAEMVDSSQLDRLNAAARAALSAKRYRHVLGVTHTAVMLAACHGLDSMAAATAGLLHDVSKERPCGELADELKALGQPLKQEDVGHPKTWHGTHAAAIGPGQFGVNDADILGAVAQHTTGDAEMSLLARLLFVADFCEPNRKIDEAPEVLELARRDITQAFCRALDLKTRHMLAKPAFELHPRTWRAIQHWLPARAREASMTMESTITAGG